MEGFSQSDIEDAQLRNGVTFPPDLVELLQAQRHLIYQDGRPFNITCMTADLSLLRHLRRHPYRRLRFDVEHNALWWPSWGTPPDTLIGKRLKLREILRRAPPLISLWGHRFLPAIPCQAGNPVISMMGVDTIYYGNDIWDWLKQDHFAPVKPSMVVEPRKIEFWSELVTRNQVSNVNRQLEHLKS